MRLGRQELLFGRERLVSVGNWRNVRRGFDGASAWLPLAGGRGRAGRRAEAVGGAFLRATGPHDDFDFAWLVFELTF